MPMKKGKSDEVISSNIHEMVKAGHPVKQAVAASLAHSRKYQNMADGGYVEGEDEDEDGQVDFKDNIPSYPVGSNEQGLTFSTEAAGKLAQAIQKSKYAANEMSYQPKMEDQDAPGEPGSDEGLLTKPGSEHTEYGTKPTKPMEAVTGESMSEEAKAAIEERKKRRRFM